MSLLTLILLVVLAWLLLSVAIAVLLGRASGGRRRDLAEVEPVVRRRDRRSARGDRRVGLPDPRPHPVERRSGRPDRRRGHPAAT